MKRLLLVAVMVLVSLVGMVSFSHAQTMSAISDAVSALQERANATNGAVSTLQATVNGEVPAKRKMYYLTASSLTGDHAITACDSGFHMASLSEIQDPSKVQYAYRRTPAYDSYDSPMDSPPSDQPSNQFPEHTGWIQTEADPVTGFAHNCDAWRFWTLSSDQQSGTTMTRRSLWGENNGHSLSEESDPAAWWQSTRTASCSQPEPVWCVEDTE